MPLADFVGNQANSGPSTTSAGGGLGRGGTTPAYALGDEDFAVCVILQL